MPVSVAVDGSFASAVQLLDSGRLDEAFQAFDRVLSGGALVEQIWYAHYTAARLRLQLGLDGRDQTVRLLRRAFEILPGRLEPLAYLARIHRESGEWATAYEFSRLALGSPTPPADSFRLEPEIYETILPLEFVQACRAMGRSLESLHVTQHLLARPNLPAEVRCWLESETGSSGPPTTTPEPAEVPPLDFVDPGWWER